MTPPELDNALDAMAAAAGDDADQMPGLVTINTNDWVGSLCDVRAPAKNLVDGMRYRDVIVHVGNQQTTGVVTRAASGERGQPFRDLLPRP